MSPLSIALPLAAVMLSLALALSVARVLRGPTEPDRFIAFDLASMGVVGLIALATVSGGQVVLLDIATVLALVSFLGTLAAARRMEGSS